MGRNSARLVVAINAFVLLENSRRMVMKKVLSLCLLLSMVLFVGSFASAGDDKSETVKAG